MFTYTCSRKVEQKFPCAKKQNLTDELVQMNVEYYKTKLKHSITKWRTVMYIQKVKVYKNENSEGETTK